MKHLLMILDDIGMRWISCYALGGPGYSNTPNIDAIAARGVRYDRYYTHPTCTPSRGSMFTGLLPNRFGIGDHLKPGAMEYLDPEFETIGDMLQLRDGASIVHVGKWHLGEPIQHPVWCGFQTRCGTLGNVEDYYSWDKYIAAVGFTQGPIHQTQYSADVIAADAIATLGYLETAPNWLLVVAWQNAHKPYHDPPGMSGSTNAEKYKNAIEYLDAKIGAVLAHVNLDQVAVTIVSDNGAPQDVGGGKFTVQENGVNVPMVRCWPGSTQGINTALRVTYDLPALCFGLTTQDSSLLRDWVYVERFRSLENHNANDYANLRMACNASWKISWDDGEWSLFDRRNAGLQEEGIQRSEPYSVAEQAAIDELLPVIDARGRWELIGQ